MKCGWQIFIGLKPKLEKRLLAAEQTTRYTGSFD